MTQPVSMPASSLDLHGTRKNIQESAAVQSAGRRHGRGALTRWAARPPVRRTATASSPAASTLIMSSSYSYMAFGYFFAPSEILCLRHRPSACSKRQHAAAAAAVVAVLLVCLPGLAVAQPECTATGVMLNARHYTSDLTAVSGPVSCVAHAWHYDYPALHGSMLQQPAGNMAWMAPNAAVFQLDRSCPTGHRTPAWTLLTTPSRRPAPACR